MPRNKKTFQPIKPQVCSGKNCYKTKRGAEQVALEQELRDIRQELKIEVYHCVYCGHWHLTSKR